MLNRSLFAALVMAAAATSVQAADLAESTSHLKVIETDHLVTITQNERVVTSYNKKSPPAPAGISKAYERSGCLHPVRTPKGYSLTAMFPTDHPHQQGIFSAWVKTTYDNQPVDFWNLAGDTGRVLHERVVSTFEQGDTAGFEVDLVHRATTTTAVDVLRERWKVTAFPSDGTYHCFELDTTQAALTDKPLIINKYHYGGFALRGPTTWLSAESPTARQNPDLKLEPSGFLNDHRSKRVEGNHQHARWVALWGHVEGNPVSIAVLCHADNLRAPQAARLHPTKPYFCFAPCFDGAFTIDRDHPFKARYRFLVTDAMPDADWIDREWERWCGKSE